MENKCDCGFTTYCDCYEEDYLKSNKTSKSVKNWDVTLMDGIEYENWDEIYEDYVGEADIHEFVQWLKDNFQVPNKLGSQDL
jgi:hypothetical protein